VTINPSAAQLNALAAKAGSFGPFGRCDLTTTCTTNAYSLVDIRKQNLGDFMVDGLDINASYHHDVSFGSLIFGVNANYELNRKQRPSPGAAESDLLAYNNSRFKMRTSAAAQTGNLLSQITWNHIRGYQLNPVVGYVPQSEVDAFNVFNLFFRYDMNGEAATKNLSFTLNVDNVFDTDPPEYRGDVVGGVGGFINGSTLGRMVQLGFSKKFF
jgi:iron complex outermembrane receptor protein